MVRARVPCQRQGTRARAEQEVAADRGEVLEQPRRIEPEQVRVEVAADASQGGEVELHDILMAIADPIEVAKHLARTFGDLEVSADGLQPREAQAPVARRPVSVAPASFPRRSVGPATRILLPQTATVPSTEAYSYGGRYHAVVRFTPNGHRA